jgi:hypothetical protein
MNIVNKNKEDYFNTTTISVPPIWGMVPLQLSSILSCISLDPLRNRCSNMIRYARNLLRQIPVREREGAEMLEELSAIIQVWPCVKEGEERRKIWWKHDIVKF